MGHQVGKTDMCEGKRGLPIPGGLAGALPAERRVRRPGVGGRISGSKAGRPSKRAFIELDARSKPATPP